MIRNEDQNEDIFLNGWEALAASIILQAAKDLRKCRKKLLKTPDHPEAAKMIRKLEKFFRSRWFKALSNDLNGAEVLNRLKHEDLSPKKPKGVRGATGKPPYHRRTNKKRSSRRGSGGRSESPPELSKALVFGRRLNNDQ